MLKTTTAAVMVCLVSVALAAPLTPDRDPRTAGSRDTDRRDGVVRPAPPSCGDHACDGTKAFRFKGEMSF